MKLLTAERMAVARGAAPGLVGRVTGPANSKYTRCARGIETRHKRVISVAHLDV